MADEIGSLLVSIGADVRDLKKATAQVKGEVAKMSQGVQKETKGIKSAFKGIGPVIAGALAGGAVISGIKNAIATISEFEDAMAGVKAITGATEKEMQLYRQAAVDISKDLGSSASDVAKGFQLVKSAMAELDADEVVEVTKQADVLSKAIGVDAATAADTLTLAMNQFGASASEAGKFVDILATSQQQGTALATQIADAMKNAGATAKAFGISFEDTNVLLQGFAKGGTVGAEAGTQLSGVLSKLAKVQDKELNPTQTDMITVLDNLAKKQLSYTELTALTDAEGAKWLSTLISQNDQVQKLADDGLNKAGSALDQANTNTNTLSGAMDKLGSTWDGFILGVENGTGPISQAFKSIIDGLSGAIEGIERLNRTPTEKALDDATRSFKAQVEAGKELSVEIVKGYEKIFKSQDDLNAAIKRDLKLAKENAKAAKERGDLDMAAHYLGEAKALHEMIKPQKEVTEGTKGSGDAAAKTVPKWEKMTKAVTNQMNVTAKLPENAKTAIAKMAKEIESAPELKTIPIQLSTASLDKTRDDLINRLKGAAIKIAPVFENLGKAIAKGFQKAGSALTGVFTSGKITDEIFDEETGELIDTEERGVKGMGAVSALASGDFIGAITEILGELASVSEVFNDIMKSFDSAITDTIDELMPVFEEVIDAFHNLVPAIVDIIKVIASAGIGVMGAIIGPLTGIITQVGAILGGLAPVFELVAVIVGKVAEFVNTILGKLTPVFTALTDIVILLLGSVVEVISFLSDLLVPIIGILVAVLRPMIAFIAVVAKVLKSVLTPVLNAVGMLLGALLEPIEMILNTIMSVLVPIMETLGEIIGVLAHVILNVLMLPILLLAEILIALNPLIVELTEILLILMEPILDLTILLLELLIPLIELTTSAGVLIEVIKGVTWVFETLMEVVDFLREAFEKVTSLFNSFSLPTGGGGGGGTSDSGGGGGGGLLNQALGLIGLADGGIVTSPTLALVGEGGESEAVIPLSRLDGMMGGGNLTARVSGEDLEFILTRHRENKGFI